MTDKPVSGNDQMGGEIYYPSPDVVAVAHIKEYESLYKRSLEDPGGFWGERAEELEWFQKWDKVLDACAKIGAAHSVVYGCLRVEALAERIEDAQSRVLITADGGW